MNLLTTARAQESVEYAYSLVGRINEFILLPLIQLMMAVSFIVFLWGGFDYIRGATDPTARQQGRRHLLYGIIGFFVMVAAYSILSFASNTVGVTPDTYRPDLRNQPSNCLDIGGPC